MGEVNLLPHTDPPAPIWTSYQTWFLNADPESLVAAAEALRAVGSAAGSARDTVDLWALRVFGEGSWEGLTAEAYQDHRGKLSGDLTEFAASAGPAADALEQVAGVLRSGQMLLDTERDRLRDVPGLVLLTGPVYFPRDEPEAATVRHAVTAAEEIRSWVDGEIACQKPVLSGYASAFTAISDAWRPHRLRHANLNAGMGRGAGTVRDNLDDLAATIAETDPDVITLQEVFEGNLHGQDGLLAQLEQETGGNWEVASFAEAVRRDPADPEYDGEWDPDNPGMQSFGNAVLVRTDGVVERTDDLPPIDVDQQGVQERAPAVAEVYVQRPSAG